MQLLNRGRTTVWRMIREGRIRGFSGLGAILVPLVDIAAILGLTEGQVYNIAIAHRIAIVQYHGKER